MWHHLIRRVFATFHAGTQAPPPTIPYHLCHINTPSCPSTTQAHNNASFAASASSAAPIDSEGPLDLWHHQPTSERCQTVSSHRGGVTVSHVSRDYNHSSLLIILDGAQRETERRRESLLRLLRNWSTLKFFSPPSFHLKRLWTAVGIEVWLTHHPAG